MNHVGEIKLDLGDYYDGPKNTIINDAKTLITEFHESLLTGVKNLLLKL